MSSTRKTVKQEALTNVNDLRRKLGAPPLGQLPQGIPGNPRACVLANAFKDIFPEVAVAGGVIRTNKEWFEHGLWGKKLVVMFDNRMFPELETSGTFDPKTHLVYEQAEQPKEKKLSWWQRRALRKQEKRTALQEKAAKFAQDLQKAQEAEIERAELVRDTQKLRTEEAKAQLELARENTIREFSKTYATTEVVDTTAIEEYGVLTLVN